MSEMPESRDVDRISGETGPLGFLGASCRTAPMQRKSDKDTMLRYFREKTIGYADRNVLRKAFSLV